MPGLLKEAKADAAKFGIDLRVELKEVYFAEFVELYTAWWHKDHVVPRGTALQSIAL